TGTGSKPSNGSILIALFSTTWGICSRSVSNLKAPNQMGFWLSFGTGFWISGRQRGGCGRIPLVLVGTSLGAFAQSPSPGILSLLE
ncbi:MAG: hypothetical protein SFV54_26300, partial [Bryobacteraceae bacterium]|nr:hypothetical protein [Bryobacteraceae bacterium]